MAQQRSTVVKPPSIGYQPFPLNEVPSVNWPFFEAGQGKRTADIIGGTLKHTADLIAAEGKDLTDAECVFTCV